MQILHNLIYCGKCDEKQNYFLIIMILLVFGFESVHWNCCYHVIDITHQTSNIKHQNWIMDHDHLRAGSLKFNRCGIVLCGAHSLTAIAAWRHYDMDCGGIIDSVVYGPPAPMIVAFVSMPTL